MPRTRLSTTVDDQLLNAARALSDSTIDAALIDEALTALIERAQATEIDARYATAYREHPLDSRDEWGDLESFRAAAGAS
jgi:hypothetical protein